MGYIHVQYEKMRCTLLAFERVNFKLTLKSKLAMSMLRWNVNELIWVKRRAVIVSRKNNKKRQTQVNLCICIIELIDLLNFSFHLFFFFFWLLCTLYTDIISSLTHERRSPIKTARFKYAEILKKKQLSFSSNANEWWIVHNKRDTNLNMCIWHCRMRSGISNIYTVTFNKCVPDIFWRLRSADICCRLLSFRKSIRRFESPMSRACMCVCSKCR